MGRSVADRIAARLHAAGASRALPAIAVENAGRAGRRVLAGTLGELPALAARADLDGPVLVLLGTALAEADIAAAEDLAHGLQRRVA
jgi:uroporphyrin-III C-methyltransferase/precorrin-2 dehydrogenase/sirohydrochlorin ferrochelatase